MYKRARPDPFRFAPLEETVYRKLGGVEDGAATVLSLSWLLGGVRFGQMARVPTPSGVVEVPEGTVWGSVRSLVEDTFAATGRTFTERQMRYAVSKLSGSGLVTDMGNVLPHTNGKYGKLYRPDASLLVPEVGVNVVSTYNLIYYGDPSEFTRGEYVVGDPRARGVRTAPKMISVSAWVNHVAKKGLDKPAFTSIGRWRSGEERDPTKPVFVPYFTIDIDRQILLEAFDDTETILRRMEDDLDLDRVYVSYSGRRGFHIQVDASQFGSPLFVDLLAATEAARALLTRYTEGMETDPSVYSPLQLIRLSGSIHEVTGNRKKTWTARSFLKKYLEEVLADLQTHEPFVYPEQVPTDDAYATVAFNESLIEAEKEYRKRVSSYRQGRNPGPTIKRIMEGVHESEVWSDDHVGRERAAFILACWLLEGKYTGDAEIDEKKGDPWQALLAWNLRNTPPLLRRELAHAYRSGIRTVS